ncbi:aldo/keto reductase [Herbidospora galbida]|uniref:Aldo/keto reductase n=1 Tax=Herbidospora galbida TaxID=2575442 RepID=A0A4U3MGL6_9ACTN|nr:aldo/keto reductase [Herbidospora galbida]TKK88578.1 aldo/keto reductase [Herbidospora galbida]
MSTHVTLNTGHSMPLVGLGTYPLQGRTAIDAVLTAVDAGYRLLDTAASYGNEAAVGAGVRESGLPRKDFFVTTKLRGEDHGAAKARAAIEGSLERLGLDYVDLYLIHWPLPRLGLYVETYAALLELAREGLIRSVGVSNFTPEHLDAVVKETGVHPAVNQRQVSPTHAQAALVDAPQGDPTVLQAWSPLERNTGVLEHPVIVEIARRVGKAPSQVVLRWLLDRGIGVVPKSGDPGRQRENIDVFDFRLDAADVAAITALDTGKPVRLDPDTHEEF